MGKQSQNDPLRILLMFNRYILKAQPFFYRMILFIPFIHIKKKTHITAQKNKKYIKEYNFFILELDRYIHLGICASKIKKKNWGS